MAADLTLASLLVSPLASRIRDDVVRERVTAAAVEALRERGATRIDVRVVSEPGAIRLAAAEAVAAGAGLVAVAGGDGTVRDAAGPLTGTSIPLGIVPAGTGNLFATAAGVPRELDAALAVLRSGGPAPRDAGTVRLSPTDREASELGFVVACGTGFDARLMAATTREAKRRFGVAAYFLAASRLLGDLAPRPTVLEVDGERQELESVVVLVANCGEAIPGRLRPRLPLAADDGRLHVFVLPRGGALGGIVGALELMLAEQAGTSPTRAGLRLSGTHVRVTVRPPWPVQVDGDVVGPGSLEARLHPGGLLVLVP